MKKINKATARKLYRDEGVEIHLLPCKVGLGSVWVRPVGIRAAGPAAETFDHRVNSFEYYNCNAELGYYAAYYIKEDTE